MKLIVVICGILATIPGGLFLKTQPKLRRWATILWGFLPFYPQGISFAYQMSYRGDTRGFEIFPVDILGLMLLFSLPSSDVKAPYRVQRYLYLAVCLLSLSSAEVPFYTWIAVWKLLRFYQVGNVATRLPQENGLGPALITGLALGVCYACLQALRQRYLWGMVQTPGVFVHQNTLSLVCNMIAPVTLAIWLRGQGGRIAPISFAAAGLANVLTLSRAGVLMFGFVTGLTLLISLWRERTRKKMMILGALTLAGLAVVIKSADTIIARFLYAPEQSGIARDYFKEAAVAMYQDYPLGVGLNHYSHASAEMGYAERLHMAPIDYGGLVHNMYYLNLAELGIAGLILYCVLYASPALKAWRNTFRDREGVRGDVLLGLAVGQTATLIHTWLEWALRQTEVGYVQWMLFGLAAGLSHQVIKRSRKNAEQRRR